MKDCSISSTISAPSTPFSLEIRFFSLLFASSASIFLSTEASSFNFSSGVLFGVIFILNLIYHYFISFWKYIILIFAALALPHASQTSSYHCYLFALALWTYFYSHFIHLTPLLIYQSLCQLILFQLLLFLCFSSYALSL